MSGNPYSNCQFFQHNDTCLKYFDGICKWCPDKYYTCSATDCDSYTDTIALFIFLSPIILVVIILVSMIIFIICYSIYKFARHHQYIEIV